MTFGGSCGGRAAVCGGSDRRTRNHMNDNGKSQLRRLSCGGCGGLSQVLDIIRCGGRAAVCGGGPPIPPYSAIARLWGAAAPISWRLFAGRIAAFQARPLHASARPRLDLPQRLNIPRASRLSTPGAGADLDASRRKHMGDTGFKSLQPLVAATATTLMRRFFWPVRGIPRKQDESKIAERAETLG
jgi:hypothetical protein